jgi:hypothetical protein
MSEMTAREKITKYCQVTKEPGRRGDVLIYGRHKYRMNRILANLSDAECEKVFKVMELEAYIAKHQEQVAKAAGRKAKVQLVAKPCECGCGRTAKAGRKFLPGHDAKLHSKLRLCAESGDVKAKAELKARGWS